MISKLITKVAISYATIAGSSDQKKVIKFVAIGNTSLLMIVSKIICVHTFSPDIAVINAF